MDSNNDRDESDIHHIPVSNRPNMQKNEVNDSAHDDIDDADNSDEKIYDDIVNHTNGMTVDDVLPDTSKIQPPHDERETLHELEPDRQPETPLLPSQPEIPQQSSTQNGFNVNKYFLYTLVAGLVISALISVVAVLIGEFNSTMTQALSTTVSMVAHTIVLLLLVTINNRDKRRSGSLIINTLLLVTVASFITSVLGIWGIIQSQMTGDLYLVYLYTIFAVLWVQLLLKVGQNLIDKPTRIISQIAIGFTALFYLMLLPTIFILSPGLPELYYRMLAATVILLATTSVLTTVFHRIFIFKHPEAKSLSSSKTAWDVIIACVVLFLGLPIIFGLISSLTTYNSFNVDQPITTSQYGETNTATPTPSSNTSNSILKDGKTQVTDEDLKNYAALASGTDCSEKDPYSGLIIMRSIDKGQLTLIDLQSNSLEVKTGYVTFYPRWKKLPVVVDKNCKQIKFTDIKAGDYISIYEPTDGSDQQDTQLIQKLN